MTADGWRRICGGYYEKGGVKIHHCRRGYGQSNPTAARAWWIVPEGKQHPDWTKPYRTLAEAKAAAS